MPVRQLAIAIVIAATAGTAAAEPAKAPVRNAAQPVEAKPVVVMASAGTVASHAPIAEAQAPAPAKRVRTARVSSCRCGGQTPTEN